MKIALYTYFKGNCNEAFEFYKEVFNGKEELKYIYTNEMTDDLKMVGKIFHAELKIDDFYMYMSDDLENDYDKRSYKLVYEVIDLEKGEEIFNKLSVGGKVESAITQMSYGPKIGALEDKFGIKWNIVVS